MTSIFESDIILSKGRGEQLRTPQKNYMKKDLIKNLLTLAKNRRDDKLILNIIYYLCVNYLACESLKDCTVENLEYLYDNLEINSEIITGDNINEYDEHLDKIKYSMAKRKRIASYEKILLLNYYKINEYWPNDCLIYLDCIDNNYVF